MDIQEAKEKAARYCAFQERAPFDVEEKLRGFGLKSQEIEEAMAYLEKEGFFDETRFALAYALGKFRNNKWGKIRIRQNLFLKRIGETVIQQALNEIPMEEYEVMAIKLIKGKCASLHDEDEYTLHNKTAAYLIRKGFEPDLVWRLIRETE